jgi:hypothetical protein
MTANVVAEIPLRCPSDVLEELRFAFPLRLRPEFSVEVRLEFKLRISEGATVYKIVYSDVTEKPETRLTY